MTRVFLAAIVVGAMATAGVVYGQGRDMPASERGNAPRPGASEDSSAFVRNMAMAGMAEVELGKLAAQRATNAEVKAFAQMMIKDHTAANDALKQVATSTNVTLPTGLDQTHRDLSTRLSKLQGAEFDREYMAAMVSGHEKVLAQITTMEASPAGTAGDRGARQWADEHRPIVQRHLEHARAIQANVAR